jgi:hypothetical protein
VGGKDKTVGRRDGTRCPGVNFELHVGPQARSWSVVEPSVGVQSACGSSFYPHRRQNGLRPRIPVTVGVQVGEQAPPAVVTGSGVRTIRRKVELM